VSDPLCVLAAGKVLTLAAASFTLSWTHSVEKTQWWEQWVVQEKGLELVGASIEASGAGMELPDNARRVGNAWHYRPDLPLIPKLVLGASGATGTGWTFCAQGECLELGAAASKPIEIWPAADETCEPLDQR
jgi:hypothetical protein